MRGRRIVAAAAPLACAAGFLSAGTALGTSGVPDTSFGGDGKVTADFGGDDTITEPATGFKVFVQVEGRVTVVGRTPAVGSGDFAVAQFLADGSPDMSFDTDG